MQLEEVQWQRDGRLAEFAKLAHDLDGFPLPESIPACADIAKAALRKLWKLKWDNRYKEVYWRLVLNGLPTAARMHREIPCAACAALSPDRAHHFWTCPVAQSFVSSLSAYLQRPVTAVQLLLCCPPRSIHSGVWSVVCLAAVVALDHVRRYITARHLSNFPPSSTNSLAHRALVRFWANLQDFCGLAMAPESWKQSVPANHPFFSWDTHRAAWVLRHA